MSVTEQDRERAAALCVDMPSGIDANDIYNTKPFREQVAFIAAALADERDRARAPFLALATEIDSRHAPYCCKVQCPEPGGRHGDPTDPVRIEELRGILGDNPPPLIEHRTLPCPGTCTCPSGPDADRIRAAGDPL